MMEALERAPSGVPKLLKADIKIGMNDLARGYSADDAAILLRRFTYQLSTEQLIAYMKEVCTDQRLRDVLRSPALQPLLKDIVEKRKLAPAEAPYGVIERSPAPALDLQRLPVTGAENVLCVSEISSPVVTAVQEPEPTPQSPVGRALLLKSIKYAILITKLKRFVVLPLRKQRRHQANTVRRLRELRRQLESP